MYFWALCLQVRKGADAGSCCNMQFPKNKVLSEWLSAQDFGSPIKQICTCALPWWGDDPLCRWFFSFRENTSKKATRELLRAPACLGRVGGFRQDLGGDFCASKISNVFNISVAADISELFKYLHMHGNWQALWSSEMRLKNKFIPWKVMRC